MQGQLITDLTDEMLAVTLHQDSASPSPRLHHAPIHSLANAQAMLPSEHALRLPEILSHVLTHLPHAPLAAALRVNRLWFECGLAVLWWEPPCTALAALTTITTDPARRALYAAQVMSLPFNGDDEGALHVVLQDLAFPRLRSLSLDSYRPADGGAYPLTQYFSPALRELHFYGGMMSAATLDALRVNCSAGLRELLIENLDLSAVTAAELHRLLAGCPALERLVLMFGMGPLMTEDLLVHLAGRTGLASLSVRGREYGVEAWERVAAEVEGTPFPQLTTLDVALPAAAVAVLVPLLPQCLNALALSLSSPGGPSPTAAALVQMLPDITALASMSIHGSGAGWPSVVRPLAALTGLRQLDLQYPDGTPLPRDELLALGQLTMLESLSIFPAYHPQYEDLWSYEPGFTTEDFITVFTAMKKLDLLRFEVQCRVSEAALYALAKGCPELRSCVMLNVFDLREMDAGLGEGVVFPSLLTMELGGLEEPTFDDPEALKYVLCVLSLLCNLQTKTDWFTFSYNRNTARVQAQMMRRCMPRLKLLMLTDDERFSTLVSYAFQVR